MQCPECQFDNPGEAVFCCKCGQKFEFICHDCGFQNPPESSFCCKCGCCLSESAISAKDGIEKPTDNSAELAKKSDLNLIETFDSERKYVTVLFSDLTGYTEMSEKFDPEEVKEITSDIFSALTEIIEKYDGFIEKYVGDAILAVFGAVTAFEDSALRAIKAAREIHAHVESISPKYEDLIGRPLSMHTGINSGLVVTGDINYQKGTHGLVGDTINTAARLMSVSKAGEIIVDRDSFIQTQGYFEFEALESVKVKGKADPIQAYRVGKALKEPKKLHRLYGLRAELIGRSIEMQVLEDAAEKLLQGQGTVIAVCGTAGTGKSRLVYEFKKTLDLRKKIQWFDANAYPYTQNTPYYPLIDLLTKAFRIEEGDKLDEIKRKVESGLEGLLGEGSDKIPFIGSLFSIEYPETSKVSPEYWKDQLFAAVGQTIKALTESGPTVICMEDIHWADPSFMELVRKLASELTGSLLIICIYRPTISFFTDIENQILTTDIREIRLKDLSPSETQSMVSSLLKAKKISKELRSFIHDKVEGNPFYVEELINSLIESGALSNKSGDWKLTGKIDESVVSTNIQGVIAGRIDRLGQDAKRILQEASVIGRAFLFDVLQRISAIKKDIDRNLVLLERLDLISARSIEPSLEYIFKHALTQEIVYNGLVKKERKAIHEKIGIVIEILFQDRLSEFYETLAYHFSKGISIDKAVSYFMKSGEKGLQKFALAEAHQSFKKAYDQLIAKPDLITDRDQILIRLLNQWSFVYYFQADWGGFNRLLSKHEDTALELKDRSTTAMFLAWMGWSHFGVENTAICEDYLSQALKIGKSIQNQEIMAYVHTWRCWNLLTLGRFDEAIENGNKALELAQIYDLNQYLHFKSRAGMANVYWYMGDRLKSFEKGQELVAFGEQHGSMPSLTFGYFEIGASYILDGDFQKANEWLDRGVNKQKDFIYYYASKLLQGMCYFFSEEYEQAEDILQPLLDFLTENSRFPWLACPGELILGAVWTAQGRMKAGLKKIHEVRKRLYEINYQFFYIVSELILGGIYAKIVMREGDANISTILKNIGFLIKSIPIAFQRAEFHFKKTVEMAKEINAKGLEGRAWLELGQLYKAKNKNTDAQQCLSKSIEIFKFCKIETYRKQAEEVLEAIR